MNEYRYLHGIKTFASTNLQTQCAQNTTVTRHAGFYSMQAESTRSTAPIARSPLLKLRKRQLVRQAQRQPRVLQHVVEAEILDLVLGRVDLRIRVGKV